jgi:phosphoglycerate dehydrogenase-like enzyme
MRNVKILSILRLSDAEKKKIEAVAPGIELVEAAGWFDGEYRDTWPEYAVNLYVGEKAQGKGTREERDALLAEAEIIVGGFPFPLDIRSRSPKLKWFHQRPAGASNLMICDLWKSDVLVTTSRGLANPLPIAEWAIAGMMYFAKDFNFAEADAAARRFRRPEYRSLLIAGKTACVVGTGGIGGEIGRLCAALGMHVVGTRRSAPKPGDALPPGFSEIRTPAHLYELLAKSDFVFVACHWTPETADMMNEAAFAAMKPGATLINVARGEIVNEDAMFAALDSGRLRGAALDVYVGEFEGPPSERMWQHPKVLVTPHTSGVADVNRHQGIDLFCQYLDDYLRGRPLEKAIDWDRTY